ncbi:MAG: phosphoribosylformylglycinamidine synthase subunit PurS [Armatimonadetes bacterium]|nr:phosphoribosylformylglycinamidine synthase subunit PurS [Armatimonadota bacterium]
MPQVKVFVTLKPTLLDAQGRVIENALTALGYHNVKRVRMGKYIEMDVDGDGANIQRDVKEMCDRLLANPVIEDFRFEVAESEPRATSERAK